MEAQKEEKEGKEKRGKRREEREKRRKEKDREHKHNAQGEIEVHKKPRIRLRFLFLLVRLLEYCCSTFVPCTEQLFSLIVGTAAVVALCVGIGSIHSPSGGVWFLKREIGSCKSSSSSSGTSSTTTRSRSSSGYKKKEGVTNAGQQHLPPQQPCPFAF